MNHETWCCNACREALEGLKEDAGQSEQALLQERSAAQALHQQARCAVLRHTVFQTAQLLSALGMQLVILVDAAVCFAIVQASAQMI